MDLFCQRVDAVPEKPAAQYRGVVLTYRELDHATNAVAHPLIAKEVRPGSLIPVLITDGLEFPIAIFSVLKAGAAFVPLDPTWPEERLSAIADQLDPTAVLATAGTVDAATRIGLASRVVTVDSGNPGAPERPGPDRFPKPSDLIYGYYTSGSTGAPKCALNHHRGLVNRLTAMSRRFGDGADHVTLQNSRSTFDSAMWQVLWPLISGGKVVLPHRDGILDLEKTVHAIGRDGVTITDFVPSVLAALVSLLELRGDLCDQLRGLRRMLIGGEAANPAVVRRLRELLPHLEVTNTYGPTECSIGSVFHDITAEDKERIPLGRPIDNTAAIILDADGRPVPAGVAGEVFLGGECIGAGYLGDEERTAKVFVPNPFPAIKSDLLYRTGDLATTDEAGLLHFIGRRDDQVKVGGVRIELGDVSTALASHPLVSNATAVVQGEDDNRILVGCVSPRSRRQLPDLGDLQQHAAQLLPAEFVPHRLVVLDALPMNQNGKIDRRVLLQLIADDTGDEEIEEPVGAMEELVAATWRQVLGRSRISVVVPFAEYGGTSLTGVKLAAALSAELDRRVPPRLVITTPTVRGQAAALDGAQVDDTDERTRVGSDAQWRPPAREPERLLLTGGTGFIGAHLLAELLRDPEVRLACLVRARDAGDAAHRLITALNRYRLTSASRALLAGVSSARIEMVPGDLERPNLGLSPAGFSELASSVDSVVHAGALVNFVAGYLAHRPANVLGTQELIRLAATGRGARLHVLSTLSVFRVDDLAHPIKEWDLPSSQLPQDGYSVSKYVAERLLATARQHGVSSVAYRLGEVWPHRDLGVANPASLAHTLLYACVRTGCVFPTEAAIDVTPVDAVSRFVAEAAKGSVAVSDGAVHVLWPSPLRFSEVFADLAARHGLRRADYPEFRRRLQVLAQAADPDERLVRLDLLLPPSGGEAAAPQEFESLFTANGAHFDTEHFQRCAESLPDVRVPQETAVALNALSGYLCGLGAAVEPAYLTSELDSTRATPVSAL
ncbi:MAG: amino acid adenylation domain-containing protein [Micromonosporaceae bacterium]